MNLLKIGVATAGIFFLTLVNLNAQELLLSEEFKDSTINVAAEYLRDYYVRKDAGIRAADHIETLKEVDHYAPYDDLEAFSLELTRCIYAMTYDKHITVSIKSENQQSGDAVSRWVDSRMDERNYYRRNNGNFKSVQKLHGNIGYLELRGFYGLDWGKRFADHAMDMLSTSDAIIIDLRNNSGGRGDMVEYLLSHFFEKPILASRSIKRNGENFTERETYTKELSSDRVMANVPLYVLTSEATFSAAEAFAYPLKVYERATLIGGITKGGANAGDLLSLNGRLNIFVPDVLGKHPWEDSSYDGVGILPDIMTRSGDALEIALELAREAAEKYRIENDNKAKNLLQELNTKVTAYEESPEPGRLLACYLELMKEDLIFEEWELNSLGYHHLNEEEKPHTAEELFLTNTILYPESPSVYDSYGYILKRQGEMKEALRNFEVAVSLGEKLAHRNLSQFRENLAEARELMKK